MKTSFLVSAVVGAHCVAVGSALLIQGCGTTRGPVSMPEEGPMPPSGVTETYTPPVAEPVVETPQPAPILVPQAKTWEGDEFTTYVVGKGDTLSHIAKRYGVSIAEIMTLNNIADPNKVRLGQKLMLPGKIDVSKPAKPAKKPAKRARRALPAGSNTYVVQPGDCLSVIAAKAGVKTKALKEANGMSDDKIFVGQTLAIPGGKPIATPAANTKPAVKPPVQKPAPAVAPTPVTAIEEELPMVDLEPEQPEPSSSATMYAVQAGDDILTVASEHNVSIADLRRVNRLSSDLLVPGQKLVIPTQD